MFASAVQFIRSKIDANCDSEIQESEFVDAVEKWLAERSRGTGTRKRGRSDGINTCVAEQDCKSSAG
jgi:hypothetical protein